MGVAQFETPQSIIARLNAVCDERLTQALVGKSGDFLGYVDGELCLFSADDAGQWDLNVIDSRPCYFWDEEIAGDGVDFDALEAELDRLAPGVFVRKDAVDPVENHGSDFVQLFSEELRALWAEAMENV